MISQARGIPWSWPWVPPSSKQWSQDYASSVFAFGFWLSRSGKPYHTILLNAHKLIALAALVYLAIAVIRANRATPLGAVEWIVVVVTGLFYLITTVSGGWVSIGKAMPAALSTVHKVSLHLTVLSSVATLYLWSRRQEKAVRS
jgi:hypothetical protein